MSCGDGIVVTGEYCFREFSLPGVDVLEIGIGDLDRDGRDEIIVQTSSDLRSYNIDDDGGFELVEVWGDGEPSDKALLVGDFDGDGQRDVLRTVLSSSTYFRQQLDGSMEFAGETPRGFSFLGEAVLDSNLDAHEEYLLVVDDPGLELGPRQVAGHRFESGEWVPVGTGMEFWSSGSGILADIDNDGYPEPILAPYGEDELDASPQVPSGFDWKSVYLARVEPGGTGLSLGARLETDRYTTSIDAGDVNGDGHVDLRIAGKVEWKQAEQAVSFIYWGHGDFTFEAPESMDEVAGSIVDLDGDGTDEFVHVPSASIWRYVDDGFQRFDLPESLIESPPSGRLADLNSDGVNDFVRSFAPAVGEPVTEDNSGLRVLMSDP